MVVSKFLGVPAGHLQEGLLPKSILFLRTPGPAAEMAPFPK
jgi:hypothetical protein